MTKLIPFFFGYNIDKANAFPWVVILTQTPFFYVKLTLIYKHFLYTSPKTHLKKNTEYVYIPNYVVYSIGF